MGGGGGTLRTARTRLGCPPGSPEPAGHVVLRCTCPWGPVTLSGHVHCPAGPRRSWAGPGGLTPHDSTKEASSGENPPEPLGDRQTGPASRPRPQGAHRRVKLGHTQAAQHVPLVTDGPERDAGSTPGGARALRDDGHIPEGDGGHLQPGPAGHQLAFSVQQKESRALGTRMLRRASGPPALDRRARAGPGTPESPECTTLHALSPRPAPPPPARPSVGERHHLPMTFLLLALENKVLGTSTGPEGTSWADIYFDSVFSAPAFFPRDPGEEPAGGQGRTHPLPLTWPSTFSGQNPSWFCTRGMSCKRKKLKSRPFSGRFWKVAQHAHSSSRSYRASVPAVEQAQRVAGNRTMSF